MTKAGVKTCRIPGPILYYPELTLPEKVLLGLVWSFKDGLRLSNGEIGKILCKHPDTVSRIIKKLERGGWLKITGKQSRWRRLYFDAQVKVKGDSTLTFCDSTLTWAPVYSDPHVKQNRRNKKEEENLPVSPLPEADSQAVFDKLGITPEKRAKLEAEGWAV